MAFLSKVFIDLTAASHNPQNGSSTRGEVPLDVLDCN